MALGSVVEFLENKSILVTGATGLLAKVLVEKILRVQPNVKKLYLLVRAADAESATLRFQNEVLGKDLFRIIKEKRSTHDFNSFILEKVTLIPGDITYEDLGLKDFNLKQKMMNELDIIVNSAATTNFNERYDVALGINTLGTMHVIKFAKKCVMLKVLVHVSTALARALISAYVAGERSGLVLENSYQMGETLNGQSGLNIDTEKNIVEQEMNKLKTEGASGKEITIAMKYLATKRAKMYGWPNTYVFTKAMGEMFLQQLKENLSVVTIRPTIISSTYKEPFPGWMESLKTMDLVLALQAQGKLSYMVGNSNVVLDAIPADMVVNAMLVAMVAHANQPSDSVNIYQVGSSLRNPVKCVDILDYSFDYFTKKPWINNNGKLAKVCKVTLLNNMDSFHRHMATQSLLPFKGKGVESDLNRNANFLTTVVRFYQPYLLFNPIFDDKNTEKLRIAARDIGVETDMFYFDPNIIEWKDYFMNIHFPGIVKAYQSSGHDI